MRRHDQARRRRDDNDTARRDQADRYNPREIERKWQARWEADELYRTPDDDPRPKWYALTMLPYTSGDLHVGHWYAMAPSDARARFKRMHGYNVLFPMGFDAFGLPAENAAIKNGAAPRRVDVREHRADARAAEVHGRDVRLEPRGRHGIARLLQVDAVVVPAAPQARPRLQEAGVGLVVPEGPDRARERAGGRRQVRALRHAWSRSATWSSGSSGSPTTPRSCWTFRSCSGPSRSQLDAAQLDRPQRRRGAALRTGCRRASRRAKIRVFTTRPDTVYGVTFFVLAPEHPLVDQITTPEQRDAVRAYVEAARREERDRPHVDRAREDGRLHGRLRHQPVQRRAGADLDRGLRARDVRHRRRHGRARRTTSATSSSRRSTG